MKVSLYSILKFIKKKGIENIKMPAILNNFLTNLVYYSTYDTLNKIKMCVFIFTV